MIIKNFKNGFTLVELLIYTAGMVIILGAIITLLMQVYALYQRLTIEPRVDRIGAVIVDRIVRDIRSGESIDLSQSQLGVVTGGITISANENTAAIAKKFLYSDGKITYQENEGEINYLSPDDISISRFYFTQTISPISQGIRIEVDITYEINKETKTKSFASFAILRHSYE